VYPIPQPFPGCADFTIMMECTPESGLYHSVCTLWFVIRRERMEILYVHSRGTQGAREVNSCKLDETGIQKRNKYCRDTKFKKDNLFPMSADGFKNFEFSCVLTNVLLFKKLSLA
jgi:hypothetical protein